MVNDKRPSRKTKDDEVGSSKKKLSGVGRNDLSASVSGSMSREASGLRRSTRNSSPVSVRKSSRLEKRTPPTTPSSSLKKKNGKPSPLRRPVRSNSHSPTSKGTLEKGSPSSKGPKLPVKGSNAPESLIKKRERQDKTLKEIALEVKEQSKQNSEVAFKTKKCLDARSYREMFKPLKKIKLSEPDKRSSVDDCDDSGASGPEKVEEGQQEHRNGEESNGHCANNIDDPSGSNSDVNSKISANVPFASSDAEGLLVPRVHNRSSSSSSKNEAAEESAKIEEVPAEMEKLSNQETVSRVHNLSSPSSSKNEAAKESDKTEEVPADGSLMEKLFNKEMVSRVHNLSSPSSSKKEAAKESDKTEEEPADGSLMEKLSNQEILSDDGVNLGCSQKVMTLGASTVELEGVEARSTEVLSLSCSCRMSILDEECAKCFRKRRLDHDSPEQELCCCLSNSSDMDDFKDRGQCGTCFTAEYADEHGQNVKQSDSPFDVQKSICFNCKLGGRLLQCGGKGCRRSYHPACSLNLEDDTYILNWYCYVCTKKRLARGVHSVSQGIESVLGVREVELSNSEGRDKQKQCFVKYKGLSHIHNRWVPEIELLHEAPELLLNLGTLKEGRQWNRAWAVPHRLLQRRAIIIDGHYDKSVDQEVSLESNSQHEWLVKWCGLDYDQATWESEDSSCFKKPEAQQLIEEYEARHNKARKTLLNGSNEVQEKRKASHVKLGKHSVGGADSFYLYYVNKLRDYHHKGHNAVLLNAQDRFVIVVYLISSLVTNVCRPFLIITTHESLSSWEAEFMRLAASINVVVYGGNADARSIIRSLEFYKDDGQVMLQVLLSTVEAIAEDVEELKGIEWEAVIIDDCQQSCISAHSGYIMNMATDWRFLLMTTQLEDNIAEYLNILSLLEPGGSLNENPGLVANSNEDINVLKDRLSVFIICASFLEYWVPVEISNLQLEQYCHSILSKSSVLRSFVKSDPVGSLREILISLRKCCDHPYIADLYLQGLLAEGITQDALMDLGIRASGKLHLLEKLLSELKNQQRKVLILFQPTGGSARDTTGNILDDFLRWRFGSDSYEHVESGLAPAKKQAACHKFNTVRERSFFLLETRACSPSIKLLLVDAVIIFDSDWTPLNDLKALQKITVDSKLEQIKVFRLYCPYTVEEKVLILAKNAMSLDSTLQSIIPSTSHLLLMWGSSILFSRLEEFHQKTFRDRKEDIVFGSSLLTGVSQEIISLFQKRKSINSTKYISVARQIGGCYTKSIFLMGEQKIQLEDEMPPHVYWTKLLEGKQPQWKFPLGSPQRSRKRVHYYEELPSEVQSDEAAKRRKTTDSTKIDSSSRQAESRLEKQNGNKEHQTEKSGNAQTNNLEFMRNNDPISRKNIGPTSSVVTNGILEAPAIADFDEIKNLHSEQRGLFELLKPTILRLCEALLLEDDGRRLVEQFLEYLVQNYRVTREPEIRLQAFLLSVCWTAAEELKKEIDHKKSLTIVREKMRFKCSECEAEDIYSKLKPKMEMFSCLGIQNMHSTGDSCLAVCDVRSISNANIVESPLGNLKNLAVELQESSLGVDCLKNQGLSPRQTEQGFEKCTKKVEKECGKQLERLKNKHSEELEKFEKSWEDRRMKLEKWCKVESAAIRVTHANSSVGIDKLRALDNDYAKKREELEKQISICRKELETMQQIEREKELKSVARYMERVKSLGHHMGLEESHARNGVKCQVTEPNGGVKDSNVTVYINGYLPKQQSPERQAFRTPEVDTNSIVPPFAENLENTDRQRVSCTNDNSTSNSDDVEASKGAGTSTCSPEQPRDSTGQAEKDTNQMEDAVTDRSTALARNQTSSASATGPLLSPVCSFAKELTADINQGLGDEGNPVVGEQASHATGICNISPLVETSSLRCSEGVLSDLPRSNDRDQMPLVPNSMLDNQPNESHTSVGGTTALRHQDQNSASLFGEADSQHFPQLAVNHVVDVNHVRNNTCASVARAVPAHASHTNRMLGPLATMSRAPTSNYSDPLQIEFDKMRNEMSHLMIVHEQKKLQLKSECDKEIEELVAQIRRKYDKKLDEAEASFSVKRNELELCQNKVMMNKMLAEAFRSKCTDYKAAPRMQQLDIASSSAESASQSHYVRPFSPAVAFAATSPATGSPTSAQPLQGVRHSTTLSTQGRIPRVNPIATTVGQQQQVRHESHASAPHIQHFRSASPAISSSSMPRGSVLMVQPPNIPTSTSAPYLPLQPPPPAPPAQLNSHGQSQQDKSMGGEARLSLSLSATELLRDIARRNDANLCQIPSNLRSLPDSVRNSESWDISQFEGAINLQPATSDVVCLSDDE